MKKMIAFALLAVAALPALAFGQTLGIYVDNAGTLTNTFNVTTGVPFYVVVNLDTGGESSSAAEWVMTELLVTNPGVFKLGTTKINNTPLDLGDNALGEYLIAFSGCVAYDPALELVRVQYGDFGGLLAGAEHLLTLRGFSTVIGEDSQISSFNGDPGFVDCAENKFPVAMGGSDGGFTGSGLIFPDGSCVLNPMPVFVPTADTSVGQIKARF